MQTCSSLSWLALGLCLFLRLASSARSCLPLGPMHPRILILVRADSVVESIHSGRIIAELHLTPLPCTLARSLRAYQTFDHLCIESLDS